jgi:mono/diheme cytochrome c family protein
MRGAINMIERTLNKKYFLTMCLMSMVFIIISAMVAAAGGKGHVHKKEGTIKIPKEYQGKKNPYWSDLDAIVAGSKIYKEQCAQCHGKNGKGDGPAAQSMSPKPFNFEDGRHMSQMNDAYLYWRTMEGGKHPSFKSDMPGYKDVLTEKEVWQVLSYAHAFSHRHLLNHEAGENITMTVKKNHHEKHGHDH